VEGTNQWLCAFDIVSRELQLADAGQSFADVAAADPVDLRGKFQVIYVAPDLDSIDYLALQNLVLPGATIEQFVLLGGVAVINVAGSLGDQTAVAPGGVGFSNANQHDDETILLSDHPYFTGIGFGGEPLIVDDFSGWGPTDFGTLTNLPAAATVLLQNADGPSLAEYPYGAGKVIVSTLSYCWTGKMGSDQAPARNLLRYSRFYSGSAYTPAPTVTATATPTVTRTATPMPTFTPTPLVSSTPTLSPTPTPLFGDANGDGVVNSDDLDALIAAIFEGTGAPGADVNDDGAVTSADIPALIEILGAQPQ